MITLSVRNVQPAVPTHEAYLVMFQRFHHISNFVGPGVVCWSQKWYASWISEPKLKANERISEEIIRWLCPLRHPLGLLVDRRLEKCSTPGGEIQKCLPSCLRDDRLHDP